jgi:hypothetical protein
MHCTYAAVTASDLSIVIDELGAFTTRVPVPLSINKMGDRNLCDQIAGTALADVQQGMAGGRNDQCSQSGQQGSLTVV